MIFIGRYWKLAYCYNMYNLPQSETLLRYIVKNYYDIFEVDNNICNF